MLLQEALVFSAAPNKPSDSIRVAAFNCRNSRNVIAAALPTNGSVSREFDYDLVIIGADVGGHGAALHAVEKGLKTAIIEGDIIGGTCVNRGCVPSKALLAVSGRMREFQNELHLKSFGLQLSIEGGTAITVFVRCFADKKGMEHEIAHVYKETCQA